jgi:pSer/pThr/pTyr-binding forkhead associated (FHA) protein
MALLEVWEVDGRRQIRTLDGNQVAIGKLPENDLVIADDSAVSRVHALLERTGGRWTIRDRDSTNGTLVNGERIFAERLLRDDDEIILGHTRIRFCDRNTADELSTARTGARPRLTPTEKKVLVELCRPLLGASAFKEPATVRQIADRLCVGEAAVKQHLGHLYDKFGLDEEEGSPRRNRLANTALDTGTITLKDLREANEETDEDNA